MSHFNAEQIAARFHEAYERLAPSVGYETRTESAKPWAEVPEQNKRLMIAVVTDLIAKRVILPGAQGVLDLDALAIRETTPLPARDVVPEGDVQTAEESRKPRPTLTHTYTRTTVFDYAPCGCKVGIPNEAYTVGEEGVLLAACEHGHFWSARVTEEDDGRGFFIPTTRWLGAYQDADATIAAVLPPTVSI